MSLRLIISYTNYYFNNLKFNGSSINHKNLSLNYPQRGSEGHYSKSHSHYIKWFATGSTQNKRYVVRIKWGT